MSLECHKMALRQHALATLATMGADGRLNEGLDTLALGGRLRREMTLSIKWIAARLQLATSNDATPSLCPLGKRLLTTKKSCFEDYAALIDLPLAKPRWFDLIAECS